MDHTAPGAILERPRPPAEFFGMGRAFRSRMLAAAHLSGPQMRKLTSDAMVAFKRRQRAGLRPEALTSLERAWRAIPGSEGQLGLSRLLQAVAIRTSPWRCTGSVVLTRRHVLTDVRQCERALEQYKNKNAKTRSQLRFEQNRNFKLSNLLITQPELAKPF